VTAVAGQFGGAFSLTASSYLSNSSPVGMPTGTAVRTIEAWVKFPSAPAGVSFGYGANTSAQEFAVFPTGGSIYAYINTSASMGETYAPNTSFHQYTSVLPSGGSTNGDLLLYIDGSPQTLTCSTPGTCTTTLATVAGTLQINGVPGTGLSTVTETADEVRISSIDRTAGWISTEYANQSNPATFLTVGTIF
jgi:hypothetical protein